jgi:hypothetical protein
MENESIQVLIDKALERKGERIRSHKFSPSSLGRCYRAQIFNRKDEPQSNPIDERTLRVFRAGNLFHEFVQDLIIANHPEAQKEVLIETPAFKGYADLVLSDEVIDIKSQHSKAFWYRKNLEWKDIEPKLLCNILQVCFYALNLGRNRARLVFISKDDLCIQEYPIEAKKWQETLNQEIEVLNGIWAKQELPPAIPRAYPDKNGECAECGYCAWKDLCGKIENCMAKK